MRHVNSMKVVIAVLCYLTENCVMKAKRRVGREVEPFLMPAGALLTQAHRGLDDGVVELHPSLCQ